MTKKKTQPGMVTIPAAELRALKKHINQSVPPMVEYRLGDDGELIMSKEAVAAGYRTAQETIDALERWLS